MDADDFLWTLAGLEAGRRIARRELVDFYTTAADKGINLVRYGMAGPPEERVVQPSLLRRTAGRLARRSPYILGGAVTWETIRRSPELVGSLVSRYADIQEMGGVPEEQRLPARIKKKASKFNKAIAAGMSAVKKSKSFGKPGSISNSKKAFASVTKTVSSLKKGKKRPTKGIRGTIARAVRSYI